MVVDYAKLGELIDGYGGISADDLDDLPVVADPRAEEIALLIDESARLQDVAETLAKAAGAHTTAGRLRLSRRGRRSSGGRRTQAPRVSFLCREGRV